MTIDEALTLRAGDYVTSPRTNVKGLPLRLTEVWVNEKRTIVLARIASLDSAAWLDALGYDLPPAGHAWDKIAMEWVPKAELERRKAERRAA